MLKFDGISIFTPLGIRGGKNQLKVAGSKAVSRDEQNSPPQSWESKAQNRLIHRQLLK